MNLTYAVMKTERAKMHLDALNRELNLFLNQPDPVIRKNYIKNSRYICRTQFKSIPPVIGSLLGEFLYCLRSGLDQLAWQLALPTAKNGASASRICFPIFESISDAQDTKNWKKVIRLFPIAVAGVIEALQPYRGSPQDHALWQLNALCNIDKHRVIPIHSRSLKIFVPNNPAALVQHFEDEDAIEVSVPLCDVAQMNFDPNSPMEIEFGEWSSDFIVPRARLTEIHDFVRDSVIPRFARFVSESPEPLPIRIVDPKPIYDL